MDKKIKSSIILSTLVCLLPIIFAAFFYDKLPERMPIHWNVTGEADNYASKAMVALGMPVIMALLNLLVQFLICADPKRAGHSKAMVMFTMWIVPAISLIFVPVSILYSMGIQMPMGVIASIFVGIIFIFCGNYLPKSRQNYTIGIKIPWTLNDGQNWNKTHRLAGYLWIICGIIMILSAFAFAKFSETIVYIILAQICIVVLIPIVYSFILYKNADKS